jgi:hypothetical protein
MAASVRFALVGLTGAIASGCGHPRPDPVALPPGAQSADPKQCQARKGRLVQTIMPGFKVCAIPYADGGKTCTDGSQCEGSCLVTQADPEWANARRLGQTVAGHCQTEMPFLGCFAPVERGRSTQAICVD